MPRDSRNPLWRKASRADQPSIAVTGAAIVVLALDASGVGTPRSVLGVPAGAVALDLRAPAVRPGRPPGGSSGRRPVAVGGRMAAGPGRLRSRGKSSGRCDEATPFPRLDEQEAHDKEKRVDT